MIINKMRLIEAQPIKNMLHTTHEYLGVSHGLSEVGYDIRLDESVRYYRNDGKPYIVYGNDVVTQGNFVLAAAMEEFQMPADLMGLVHDKSTWARYGMSVFNTAIKPGWNGFLTLELVFHGKDIHIPAGVGIAQVVFHELAIMASYKGRYQSQERGPVLPK